MRYKDSCLGIVALNLMELEDRAYYFNDDCSIDFYDENTNVVKTQVLEDWEDWEELAAEMLETLC